MTWGVLSVMAIASSGCGSGSTCGLALIGRAEFPPANKPVGELGCCGAAVFQDVDLSLTGVRGDIQVDLINESAANGGRVDMFLTTSTCEKLFSSYAGAATAPLCTIYAGPVSNGATSARKKIARGKYRIFVQAYSANESPAQFLVQVGIWSDDCRRNPIGPPTL